MGWRSAGTHNAARTATKSAKAPLRFEYSYANAMHGSNTRHTADTGSSSVSGSVQTMWHETDVRSPRKWQHCRSKPSRAPMEKELKEAEHERSGDGVMETMKG